MAARANHAGHVKADTRKGNLPKRAIVAVLAALCAALVCIPIIATAALPNPSYTWYTSGVGTAASPYTISSTADWVGFVNLVNGTADVDGNESTPAVQDSFAGKHVKLAATLNFRGELLTPAGGGQYGTSFDGTFDGGGNTVRNYVLSTELKGSSAQGATENIGLFGKTGAQSSLANLNVADATVNVKVLAGDSSAKQQAVRYVGTLAGFAGGPISNCSADGAVTVTSEALQTKDLSLPIQWVGGMAGAVEGDLSSCSSSVTVNVSEPGAPDADMDQATIVFGIGGIAGCVGSPDSSVDSDTARVQADISDCSFSGTLSISTPCENGKDRFGNKIYALACTAGGIAGYARGDVSDCVNSGTISADHTTAIGGIVGSLRGKFEGSNFVGEGSDDGMADGAAEITLSNCFNTGSIHGWANAGGIVGRAGTNTVVTSSFNGLDAEGNVVKNYVLAGRSTKPYPAGIASSVYGKVCYCANFGEVSSIANSQPVDLNAGTYTTGGGYYAAGITGILQYYTDADGVRTQDMSEVYGCYNAGPVRANANMRQRALVGDNEGYVHDCLAVIGFVENDEMFYVESDNGTNANCSLISAADLKGNVQITVNGKEMFPAVLLNANADADGWEDYWVLSQGGANNGYPVVDNQVTWTNTDLAAATVTLAKNAEYSGVASVPQATVVIDGNTLIQNIDFRVVPQADATEITAAGQTPYTADVVGIGAYTGTAASRLKYGIGKGDMANCAVLVDSTVFNWEAQLPTADQVHVTNRAGAVVSPDEYTFAIDPADEKLTDGAAVNAGTYNLVVSAKPDSTLFYGQASGDYSIAKVRIIGGGDGDDSESADVKGITYLGEVYPWQSTGTSAAVSVDEDNLLELEYTGHSIKPTVTQVTYLGRDLVEGRDYRVVYGQNTMDGDVDDTPNTEVGDGWIIVRFVAGSNFNNYDLMHFKILESTGKHDLSKAEVNCPAEVVYEPGEAGYEPVTVTYGGSPLTEGVDYTIEYKDNNAVGTATYTITGKGSYTGTKSGSFKLVDGEAYAILYDYDATSGTATVTGVEYNGIRDTFDLVIPATTVKDGVTYNVTAIANKACGGDVSTDFALTTANQSKRKIASVQIPASVKTIGQQAFGSNAIGYGMTNLKSVVFADGSQLQTIGKQAFASTAITEVTIPATVTRIGDAAFKGASLTTVTFMSKDASIPVMNSANTALNSFRDVKAVQAYGYDSATAVKSYVTTMDGLDGYSWQWNSLGDAPADYMLGDVNGDKKVNSEDALYVLQYSAQKIDASALNLAAADVNGDKKVNSEDALYILQFSANKITRFPAEQ